MSGPIRREEEDDYVSLPMRSYLENLAENFGFLDGIGRQSNMPGHKISGQEAEELSVTESETSISTQPSVRTLRKSESERLLEIIDESEFSEDNCKDCARVTEIITEEHLKPPLAQYFKLLQADRMKKSKSSLSQENKKRDSVANDVKNPTIAAYFKGLQTERNFDLLSQARFDSMEGSKDKICPRPPQRRRSFVSGLKRTDDDRLAVKPVERRRADGDCSIVKPPSTTYLKIAADSTRNAVS
jgi:hypothetical protein